MENGIDIEALKNDKEFLENLKLLEQEMREQNSIAKGYELLNAKILIGAKENEINEIFTFIVERAFDKFGAQFEKQQPFDINDKEDVATLRAIYEFAMQNYSEGQKKDASELFLALSMLSNDSEFSDAMMVHYGALNSGYSFEDFIEKLAVVSDSQLEQDNYKAYFVTNFSQPIDIMLQMFEKEISKVKNGLSSPER